jgi:hypothetical protein
MRAVFSRKAPPDQVVFVIVFIQSIETRKPRTRIANVSNAEAEANDVKRFV